MNISKGGAIGMEVYLDIFLLENFVVNLFLLNITFKVMRVWNEGKKLTVSALIGTIYSIVMVFPNLKVFTYLPFQFFIAFLMIRICMRDKKIQFILKGAGIYIFSALTLSGVCLIFSLLQNSYSLNNGLLLNNYSLKYLIISMMIIYILYERITSYFRERALITNFIYDIEISIDNIRYVIRGFLDTGNELREPVTNLPCIIIEECYLSDYHLDDEKAYYIPYSAIGYSGKIKGFKGDKVRIRREGENWRDVEAIICPCNEVLSRDKEFNALLSRGII